MLHRTHETKILKVSSSLIPKLEIRLRQRNKVELTLRIYREEIPTLEAYYK